MVVPDDCRENFSKEKAQYEDCLMTDQASAWYYPASQPVEGAAFTKQRNPRLDEKEYGTRSSVKAGVLKGSPTGASSPTRPHACAEAVVMIQRMLEEMEEDKS